MTCFSKLLSWLAVPFLLGILTLPAQATSILVIESYLHGYPWDASYKRGLASLLPQAAFSYFEMDTKRLPPDQHVQQAELAWQRYLDTKPDLVVFGDDNALKYLGPKFRFTETPVVFLGINNNLRTYDLYPLVNITGVLERPMMKRNIAFINRLMGHRLKKLLVLFDSGTTSKVIKSEVFNDVDRMRIGGVEVHLRLLAKESEWHQTVREAKQNGFQAVIVGLFHTLVDERGINVNSEDLLAWTNENTPVPHLRFGILALGPDEPWADMC